MLPINVAAEQFDSCFGDYVEWITKILLYIVQDFPQRSSAGVHRENRRRHYYAREDSDEEEVGLGSMQREAEGALSEEQLH